MDRITSKDGTGIAFDRSGKGPAVILVGGALQTRMGNAGLAVLLQPHFTVFNYDRRGRGDSDAVKRYAVGDEIEEYFMTKATGLPPEFVTPMRNMPFWPSMEAMAQTLAYDGAIVAGNMAGKPVQAKRWTDITVPTLVLDGGTTPWLSEGAEAIAKALPNAKRQTLQGQTHDVSAEALAPALTGFFKG